MKKKLLCCIMTSMLVLSFASCGSKKTTVMEEQDSSVMTADKVYAKETTSNTDKDNGVEKETETEIYLENTSGKELVIKDDSGEEIKLEEGETLAVKEKTTDEAGDEVYVLENGATVKVESVTEAAKEKTTVKQVIRNIDTAKADSDTSTKSGNPTKSTEKSITNQTVTERQTQAATPATVEKQTAESKNIATQQKTPASTEKQTAAPTQAVTQPATQKPTEAPTPAPTQKPSEKATEKPTERQTEAPTTAASYTGFRTDLDMQAKQMILELRKNEPNAEQNPVWNEHLYKVAQARAKEIVSNFSHTSNGEYKSGYNINEALTKFSISYFCDDNYKEGAKVAIDSWKNSPEHYDIMMMGNQMAVSCYQEGDYLYCVCLTGTEMYYIAENSASLGASEWGSVGSAKYEEKYKKYYDSFVSRYGERKIW